jgi:hypothetical protein
MRINCLGVSIFGAFMVAGVVAPPIFAVDLNLNFSFGPNPVFPPFSSSSASRTLNVPGKTLVSVRGSLNPLTQVPGGIVAAVPVIIEVLRPEGGVAATINTAAAALVSVPFVFALPPTFISDFGCPRTWRVRVRTSDGTVPLVTVSGTITYSFFVPGVFPNPLPATYNVDMEGPPIHLEGGGSSSTPTLAGHDPVLLGAANRSLIQSTEGVFRIRGKWDTAFHVCYLNQRFQLNAALLKPGGTTVADSETGFSQTSSETPKLDFSYTVTPNDALLAGSWRLRITNNNTVNNFCTLGSNLPVAIDNFDVENLLPPAFQSTFTPQCSGGVGSWDLTPTNVTTSVHQRVNYVFSWTVPEPLNWHDLGSLQFRIRDGEETILWLKFDEATNQFSLFKEGKEEFGHGFPAGSSNRLETPEATVHLAESSVQGSGPTGPSVALNLSLSFKPKVAGRTLRVEVAATDDHGTQSVFEEADVLTVNPLK